MKLSVVDYQFVAFSLGVQYYFQFFSPLSNLLELLLDEKMMEWLRTADWASGPERTLFLRYFLEIYAKMTPVSITDIYLRASPRLYS